MGEVLYIIPTCYLTQCQVELVGFMEASSSRQPLHSLLLNPSTPRFNLHHPKHKTNLNSSNSNLNNGSNSNRSNSNRNMLIQDLQ
jgi:hypothetical protein